MKPTLDAEIEAKKLGIESNINHTSREEYIATVQPLKDELASLIEQNDIIKAENQAELDAMPPTTEEIEEKRELDIKIEIEKTYSLTDEIRIVREALVELLPDAVDVQAWNDVVVAAKEKYLKE